MRVLNGDKIDDDSVDLGVESWRDWKTKDEVHVQV